MPTPSDPDDPPLWSRGGGDDDFHETEVFSTLGELKVEIEACLDHFAASHHTVAEIIEQLQAISDRLGWSAAETQSEALLQASYGLTQVLEVLDNARVNLAEVHEYGASYLRSLGFTR
ncbi:hypothetical protein GCM10020358_67080 [Amorphoplanes nipponensis]|uniref:Uncharacterized protein n=1 Tax=Actinoplanes nipponensis TaxID=135950 RepID=A0A919JQW1_9ACTN|nr:hypothetical protein [Actinoplanes nipponensis]GIE53800.1 hypothetical protein Ani05nite_73340 [Actinoplanes nipponensis]